MDAPPEIRLARAADTTDSDPRALRRSAERGQLVRPHRGAFVDAARWAALSPQDQYRTRIIAAAMSSRTRPVVSHVSAAVLHGAPLVGGVPGLVHVVSTLAAGTRSEHGFRKHATGVPGGVIDIDGIAVTALVRTLADVAVTEPFLTAVAILDWAFARHPITAEDVLVDLDRRGVVRGRRRAAFALAFADPRSGSPGESLSRVRFRELGCPTPDLQHPFSDALGLIGIVDFWWPALRTVGEFDGVAKYIRDEYTGGRSVAEIVLAEKSRENRLRALGLTVVRWDWDDAWRAQPLRALLVEAGVLSRR
jgi:hypothetical protein